MVFGNEMNDKMKNGAGVAILIGACALSTTALSSTGARAQTVPAPDAAPRTIPGLVIATPTPTPTRTPVPVPTGPVLGLPSPTPSATPRAAEPVRRAPERSPAPTSMPTRAAQKTPSKSIAPADEPTPTPTPTTSPTPTPAATIATAPSPAATPTPAAPATTAPVAVAPIVSADAGGSNWPWLAGGAAPVILALGLWFWWRRRARRDEFEPVYEEALPEPEAPAPIVVPVVPAGPRASIAIALRPIRAGLNMLSATVEAEVVVTNMGDAPAAYVRVHATLLSAHAGQEADLAIAFAAPTGRPAAPPFPLAPGEERRVRVVAALSREAVRSMEAGGRPMFVPLVAIDVRYAADAVGTPARTGQAFIVGVERVDSAKLAPFWLDGPLRMHDQLAARVQGVGVTG